MFRLPRSDDVIPKHHNSTFFLDDMYCGVDVSSVEEVIRCQELTRVPLASRVLSGLMNLRGQIATSYHLEFQTDLDDRPADGGLENMDVRPAEIQPPPTPCTETFQVICSMPQFPGGFLFVIDIDQAATIPPGQLR